ncbi:MAG: hypothetical protein WCX73_03900 [Candidatus Pacearchaeota archaeon]|jgi:hypothetical protein
MIKTSSKEAIELAEQHVKLAQDLIYEQANESKDPSKKRKELSEAAFALEKAESEIQDVEEVDEE